MHIRRIELTNFRNYEKIKLENLDNINIIIGNNGIGKTSILESIYVASTCRTFKSNDEGVLVNSNKDFFKVKVDIENNGKIKKLDYILTDNGKKTKINNILKRRISDYIFQYKVILFSPDEMKLIKESPNVRRNYLNVSLSQINKSYMKLLKDYNVLIKNKNEYLKRMYVNSNMDSRYLDIIDEKIAEIGSEICKIRSEYISKINKYLRKNFQKFRRNDNVYVKYSSQFLDKDKKEIVSLLKKNRDSEMNLSLTRTGIHRDDFLFLFNGNNARDYSSEGIQKLILLCFKLSELEVLSHDYYEEPILLLDDLFSELDIDNQNNVLNNLNKNVQVFITTTDINNVKKSIIKKAKIIDLNGGGKYER